MSKIIALFTIRSLNLIGYVASKLTKYRGNNVNRVQEDHKKRKVMKSKIKQVGQVGNTQ